MVDKHPLGEVGFLLALDIDVDQHPGFRAVAEPDLDEFIRQPSSELGVPHHVLEFLLCRAT